MDCSATRDVRLARHDDFRKNTLTTEWVDSWGDLNNSIYRELVVKLLRIHNQNIIWWIFSEHKIC